MMTRSAMAVLALLALVASGASGQEEIVESGNRLYQEGDFAGAIEAYEAVRSAGFESPDLDYNLGNAYFKAGLLGPAILEWERALAARPGDPDVLANLELARSLTADAIEPMPRFWLLSALRLWVDLVPRTALIAIVGLGWLLLMAGAITRVLSRTEGRQRLARWSMTAGAIVVVLLGSNLIIRESGIGTPDRGVILAEAVPVRSAPADDDNLTIFEIHEGTVVRIDQQTGEWAEVVLADGQVGWVRVQVLEII